MARRQAYDPENDHAMKPGRVFKPSVDDPLCVNCGWPKHHHNGFPPFEIMGDGGQPYTECVGNFVAQPVADAAPPKADPAAVAALLK